MIRIQDLKPEDRGRWIRYVHLDGFQEEGRIKFWNDKFVFVVFHCAGLWDRFDEFTAEAADPEDLNFI